MNVNIDCAIGVSGKNMWKLSDNYSALLGSVTC